MFAILMVVLSGCAEADTYVGTVKEIKEISTGGFGKSDKALVVLEDGREIVIGGGIGKLEIGSEISTANKYTYNYQVRR